MIQFSKKAVVLMALMLVSMTTFAGGRTTKSATTSGFDWNPVMDAIILVESEGNPKAKLSRRDADYSDSC